MLFDQMNRTTTTREARPGASTPQALRPEDLPRIASRDRDLEDEVLALQREIATLRSLRQRDQAMARGLGVSLQELRRGALALRADNEELRRALHAARSDSG
jgi:hypothetical protein